MASIKRLYSISDLLKMDAKGKKGILPYVCLTEARDEEYLLKHQVDFYSDMDRVVYFINWMEENRKTTYTLFNVFETHSTRYEDCDLQQQVVLGVTLLLYYYSIHVEKSINVNTRLHLQMNGSFTLLRAKNERKPLSTNSPLEDFIPDEILMKLTEGLYTSCDYEDKLNLLEEVPDSFMEDEKRILICLFMQVIEMLQGKHRNEKADLIEQFEELENQVVTAMERQEHVDNNFSFTKKELSQVKSENKQLEEQVNALQEELLAMQNKITSLEDRNRVLSFTMSESDISINEELIDEENTKINLDDYNIVLCGQERYLKKYNWKLLDYRTSPQRITMLDKADIVAIVTSDIEHSSYYPIKNYCRNHGITFCNINGNTQLVVETALKNFIRENLL